MIEHIFLIRIWCEPREIEGACPEYRGMIQHTPTGEKHYLTDLEAIPTFIKPYLEEMGVEFGILCQIRLLLGGGM